MDISRLTDDELLRGSVTDPEMFGLFYRRMERPMLLFMLRRTGDAELSADLTAEVFAQALVSVRRFRPQRGPAAAWLFGIAKNVLAASYRKTRVVDKARRRLEMAPLELDDELVSCLQRLIEMDDANAALERLGWLPAEQEHAVRAHVLEGQDYADIARDLECSTSVVRKRVSRGLASLRTQMGGI